MRTLYDDLGVGESASAAEIRSAFRRSALENHPDRHPGDARAAERFMRSARAYKVLGDEKARKEYDEERAAGQRPVLKAEEAEAAAAIASSALSWLSGLAVSRLDRLAGASTRKMRVLAGLTRSVVKLSEAELRRWALEQLAEVPPAKKAASSSRNVPKGKRMK